MSDPDPIEVLVEWKDEAGDHRSLVLGRGETMGLEDADATINHIEVRPAEDQEVKADGGTERFGYLDERWEREVREKKKRGQDGLDESQTVREAAQPLVTSLRGCRRSDHCHRLAEVVTGAATVDSLDYEDLFYPLRCHRDDGLVLRVELTGSTRWMQYGAGDLFYWLSDADRSLASAIETNNLWEALQSGMIEVEPVLVEDTPFGEDD
jgi:hypothetical protein